MRPASSGTFLARGAKGKRSSGEAASGTPAFDSCRSCPLERAGLSGRRVPRRVRDVQPAPTRGAGAPGSLDLGLPRRIERRLPGSPRAGDTSGLPSRRRLPEAERPAPRNVVRLGTPHRPSPAAAVVEFGGQSRPGPEGLGWGCGINLGAISGLIVAANAGLVSERSTAPLRRRTRVDARRPKGSRATQHFSAAPRCATPRSRLSSRRNLDRSGRCGARPAEAGRAGAGAHASRDRPRAARDLASRTVGAPSDFRSEVDMLARHGDHA